MKKISKKWSKLTLPGLKLKRQLAQNIILIFTSILILGFAGEIFLRFIEPQKSKFEFIVSAPGTKRLYEFSPYSSGKLLGHDVSINSNGIRDREFEIHKPSNTFRIIGLGDSITMAAGLDLEESYLKKLEFLLNKRTLPGL